MATKEFRLLSGEAKDEINSLIVKGLKVFNVPPEILCSHCGLVPVFHYVFSCSHVYCLACHNLFIREKRKCDKCQAITENETRQDKKIEHAIYNLQTECPNIDSGCKEHVTFQYILEHMGNCKFNKENLFPKLYTETAFTEAEKKVIDNISRDFEIKLQTKTLGFTKEISQLLEQLQKQSADNAEMRQRLEATEMLTRETVLLSKSEDKIKQLENMLANLKVQITSQESSIKIMNTTIRSTNELTEQKIESKFSMCCNNIEQLKKTKLDMELVDTIRSQDSLMSRQSQQYSMDVIAAMKAPKNGVIIWEIKEVNKKRKLANTSEKGFIDFFSNDFYSSEYGYKMKLQVRFNKDGFGVFQGFVPGENDAYLPTVFQNKKSFYILDQSDRNEKRHFLRLVEPRYGDDQSKRYMKNYIGRVEFCTYLLLETKFKNTYLKNDVMFLKVVVEPIFPLARSPFSYDGILLWHVSNYKRTKQESQDEMCNDFYSDSFYSSPHGYRMKCYLYFTKNYLHIRLCFLEGEFDDLLFDVYAHKVTFSVLDQVNKSKTNKITGAETLDPKVISNNKAKEKMGANECCGVDFLYSSFEKSPFHVDDSILIKIDVKPI